MVFSSPIFLFFFLPITLLLGYLTRNSKQKNLVLLIASIFFYIFGEGEFVLLMFGSVTLNYFLGKWVGKSRSKASITTGIIINLVFLVTYKYSMFLASNLNLLFSEIGLPLIPEFKVKLPAGISFYTFHSISYLIDVYRKDNTYQKSYVDMALYICLFPQLIAGPIIRYKDIAYQFARRRFKTFQFHLGIERFIIGLGKKVIIANTLGYTTDLIYGLNPTEVSPATAWLAIICYSLQLYFDFSGYSDMAIGLAKMFGFDFLENFRFPYVARSVKEFWTRWHISLSNWFRDYLYIPLGGNRMGNGRMYLNLSIVFFLTGLWHGASWNFVIWGMIHGVFMVIERLGFSKMLERSNLFSHVYTLFVVMMAWIFFRVDTLTDAIGYIQSMFGFGNTNKYTINMFLDREVILMLVLGIVLSFNGVNRILLHWVKGLMRSGSYSLGPFKNTVRTIKTVFLILIFIYALMNVVSGTYNPFIYFRF